MTEPKSFGSFEKLIELLAIDRLALESEKLEDLLKKVAWTSGSEFYGEFGLEMKKIKSEKWRKMSPETRAVFDLCVFEVRRVWPHIGL